MRKRAITIHGSINCFCFFFFIFDYGFYSNIVDHFTNYFSQLDCCRLGTEFKRTSVICLYWKQAFVDWINAEKLKTNTHTQKIKYENEQLNDIFVSFECKVVVVWHEGKPKIKTKIKPTNFTELIWRTCFELNIYYEFISIFNVLWLLNRPLGKFFFPSASFSIITTLILFLCFWWSSVWDNGFWIWLPLARIHFSRRTYWNKSPITVWCVSVWIIRNKQHFLQCGTVCSSCFSVCFFSLRRNIYLKCENEYGPITGIYKPNANDIWRDWR